MDCINCENCKMDTQTYYCVAKNEFVIHEQTQPQEKVRGGWKKGVKEYELHRRNARKEIEA